MNVVWLVFLSFVVIFILAAPVYAGVGSCGDLEEDTVEEAYDAAKRVDHVLDVISDIERACKVAEAHEDWEKAQSREFRRDRVYKRNKRRALLGVEEALEDMRAPLITLYARLRSDPSGSLEHAKRVAYIRLAKKKIKRARDVLNADVRAFEKLSH